MVVLPFDSEKLDHMNRAELQKLCKQLGIKANSKTTQLIQDLKNYAAANQEEEATKTPIHADQQKDHISSERQRKTPESDEKNKTGRKRKRTYSVEKEADKKLHVEEGTPEANFSVEEYKKDLMEHLEKTAEKKKAEQENKLPALSVVGVRMPIHPAEQTPDCTHKNWDKIHKSQFDKMDSIDVYLEKKRKRNEQLHQSVKKAKQTADDARSAVEILKQHKTPTNKNARRSTQLRKPQIHVANTFMSPIRTSKVRKSALFNFATDSPVSKSTVFQFKAKSGQNSPKQVPPAKKPAAVVARAQRSLTLPVSSTLRKTGEAEVAQNENVQRTLKPRKSSVSGVTPFRFAAAVNTPLQPKPAKKFDLRASLNKPLSYKPYTGKLKQPKFVVNEEKSKPKGNPYKEAAEKIQQRMKTTRADVKKVKTTSRNERRMDVVRKRASKRDNAVMSRRGINA